MFNMPTNGPLSPTVSLERQKLEQAGVQPGQEQQAAASMGSPINGNLAQLIQLNRMIQQQGAMQQQANAAPSTVAQDLMQLAMQQRASQMRPQMPPQMQGQPRPQMQGQPRPQMQGQPRPQMPPQMDPRQQGIANLPQQVVGNGMAAGGIVAFENGGNVRHFAGGGLTDQEKAELAKLEMLHTAVSPAYGAGYDTEMAKQQTRARYQELRARQKAAEQEPAQSAGNFNMVQEAMKQQRPAVAAPAPDNVKQAIAAARAARPSRDEGLAEFVPTLSYSKRDPLDLAVENAGFDLQKDYGKIRKKMEEESGLTGIWKRQQEEQERLKAEASPEEQKRAFWNNLSARLADQSGQRGVSRSSRLAQMVGAIGGARSSTEEEFKKRNAELNKAALDLQEKQAMYRMTGTMADREALAKANQNYEKAALDKQTAERLAAKDAAEKDFKERQLKVQAAAGGREKTPWESLGPNISRLINLIQAKQASGASAQEIAPIQAQLDSLMKNYNTVNPGLYGADKRADTSYAAIEQKARQAAANTVAYRQAEARLRLIQSNPEVNPITGQKFKTPAERDAAIQNLRDQQDRVIADHMVKLNREGAAQGDAGGGSGRVIDFNSLPPT
jgi:hypothetical protein